MKDKKLKELKKEEIFVSEFDSLGGYTGNSTSEGYEPEQDADDM